MLEAIKTDPLDAVAVLSKMPAISPVSTFSSQNSRANAMMKEMVVVVIVWDMAGWECYCGPFFVDCS